MQRARYTPALHSAPTPNDFAQVPLVTLLRKFDGVTEKEEISGDAKRYSLTRCIFFFFFFHLSLPPTAACPLTSSCTPSVS
jgi:hypothetical protein